MARFKELCMDTDDGDRLGRFWADVAGLEFRPDDEAGDLLGPEEGHGIAMCRVPEPKSVKHRVHLDVYATSIGDLVAKGAQVVLPAEESGFRWTVLTDPEGGEFCAFLRSAEEIPEQKVHGIVVDCRDPGTVARWWADVFGTEVESDEQQGWWGIGLGKVPGLPHASMDFNRVPEPKTVKNRIHWDVYGDVETLRARGATVLRPRDEDAAGGPGRISWTVMADPEGNEFCVFER